MWEESLQNELVMRLEEGSFIEMLRHQVGDLLPPTGQSADGFMGWFAGLELSGPGQQHGLFDWLATHASDAQLRWFLQQEAAGEAGFDDLLAYTQVRLPTQAKLECARNFWDEMGHGRASRMHGPLLDNALVELGLYPDAQTTVWESLALANTMVALATNRRYAYQSIGALGVIELTAPSRVKRVSLAMRRLNWASPMRAYFDLHGALDVSHAQAWMREVIRPLIEADPACARFIAEGALMRLLCGQRCFDRYTREFQLDRMVPASPPISYRQPDNVPDTAPSAV
jgi:Iron-containing redox enzyme